MIFATNAACKSAYYNRCHINTYERMTVTVTRDMDSFNLRTQCWRYVWDCSQRNHRPSKRSRTINRFHMNKKYECITQFSDEAGSRQYVRHVCTIFRTKNRRPDLRVYVQYYVEYIYIYIIYMHNAKRRCTLELLIRKNKATTYITHFSAHKSNCRHCFSKIDIQKLNTCCMCPFQGLT